MAGEIQNLKNQYARAHRRFARWKQVVITLSAVIAVGTGYVLISPAQTQEQVTYCGCEQHTEHTENCYGKQLICTLSEEGHTHTDACYEEQDVLACGWEETAGHIHTEECYGSVRQLTCGLEETEGHTHTAECCQLVSELTCTIEETDGHIHDEACYEEQTFCICGQDESEEHTHTEACYETRRVQICTQQECNPHHHTEACYTTHEELICTLPVCEPHTHTDACYEEKPGLICGQETCEPHTHDASCYTKENVLVCGQEESEPHKHTDECYRETEELICELPLHEHTLQCFSNPDADLESEAVWSQLVSGVTLTGNWANDFVAVARTQLGYTESAANYMVLDDGVTINGYSRYGAWYGAPYGDWCAMFCSFCLHYAGIEAEFFPYDMTCDTWIGTLCGRTLQDGTSMFRVSPYYSFAANMGVGADPENAYRPVKGDLVFFDTAQNGIADHVGIVYEVSEDGQKFATIEGNLCDAVSCASYSMTDPVIVGYGVLPENPCSCKACCDKYGTRLCGEDCTCACHAASETEDETRDGTEADNDSDLPVSSISEEMNGVTVTVTGKLPEGSLLLLSEVPEEQLQEILAQTGGDTSVFAYDITIVDDEGKTWQPDELGAVVSITGLAVSAEEEMQVVHVPDEGEIEEVESETTEGTVEFTAESFSIYVVYRNNDLIYSITSGSSVTLSEIFTKLLITDKATDVTAVTSSTTKLTVAKNSSGDDWTITNSDSFTTEETLTVTFASKTLTIKVTCTDDSASGTSIIPATADKKPNYGKYIDSFSDGTANEDTDLDDKLKNGTISGTLEDFYRLYLKVGNGVKYDGVDVLFVVDASNSMTSSKDAYDINNSTSKCYRSWALDTLLNGKCDTAASTAYHQNTVYSNGLIGTISSLNADNQISVVSFNSSANLIQDWVNASSVSSVSIANSMGTNYQAGLEKATTQLQSTAITNDTHKKIMIFLSDGDPNQGSTESAIKTFTDKFKDVVDIFTIGVGTNYTVTYLNNLSTSGSTYSSSNFGELLTSLTKAIKNSVLKYTDVLITDTLSNYVDFYEAELDFLIHKINDTNNTKEVVYQKDTLSGASTVHNTAYIKDVSIDPTQKTVTVEFKDDYELDGNTTFRISFNVKVTDTAKNEYTTNKTSNPSGTGYGDTTGDADTDYTVTGNSTSSCQAGFYSNGTTAKVDYTCIALSDTVGTLNTLNYAKPVVQVSLKSYYTLPETGGRGTAVYQLTGAAIIVTTLVFFHITQKKKEKYHYENY